MTGELSPGGKSDPGGGPTSGVGRAWLQRLSPAKPRNPAGAPATGGVPPTAGTGELSPGNAGGVQPQGRGSNFLPPLRFEISAAETRIGRSGVCEYNIPDLLVSRMHARLIYRKGTYFLQDLRSANGTWVNGERITLTALRPGDRIRIGSYELEFQSEVQIHPPRKPNAQKPAPALRADFETPDTHPDSVDLQQLRQLLDSSEELPDTAPFDEQPDSTSQYDPLEYHNLPGQYKSPERPAWPIELVEPASTPQAAGGDISGPADDQAGLSEGERGAAGSGAEAGDSEKPAEVYVEPDWSGFGGRSLEEQLGQPKKIDPLVVYLGLIVVLVALFALALVISSLLPG